MENVFIALISASSALVGVWITQYYENIKRKSEEKRWYVDYFLGRKIDALTNLYAALVDCYSTLDFYEVCAPATIQEFRDKVSIKVDVFLRAKATASIYLNDEAENLMIDVCGVFKHGRMAVWLNLPKGECPADRKSYDSRAKDVTDDGHLEEKYKKAVEWFKNNLNPKILEGLKGHG